MHRTGITPGEAALNLVRDLVTNPALRFAGLHAYDGHIHDASLQTRKERFAVVIALVEDFATLVEAHVGPVPLIVSGGSPTFGLHAEHAAGSLRPWQCSPGTTVLWDVGYGGNYSDLPFDPAALLLTRVVSHPGATDPGEESGGEKLICLDLGHKAVAAENPIARRVFFPDLPEAAFVSQSEEHLVVRIKDADKWPVGTPLLGLPIHVCPTVALHQEARVVTNRAISGESWDIAARDRRLSI